MLSLVPLEPVDYLVIGHAAHDLTPSGARLGGTVAFSALTARALGLRVGIVTSVANETSSGRVGWHPRYLHPIRTQHHL